jgi:hypothetical protein
VGYQAVQRLTIAGLFLVAGFLLPSVARAAVTVDITTPLADAVVGNAVQVTVNVTSTYQVATVVASVEGQQANLTFSSGTQWTGTLALDPLSSGPKQVDVLVTDVFSTTGSDQSNILLDRPPTLIVSAPLDATIADPSVYIEATCVDDFGCTVYAQPTGGLSGPGGIAATISLASYEDQEVEIQLGAYDASSQFDYASRVVLVESGGCLTLLDSVDAPIVDFDEEGILYAPDETHLAIFSRLTHAVVDTVATPATRAGTWITPVGSFFATCDSPYGCQDVYEWRNGVLGNLGAGDRYSDASGGYAAWATGVSSLVVRDLLAGTSTTTSPAGPYQSAGCPCDVADNGALAFKKWGFLGAGYHGPSVCLQSPSLSTTCWTAAGGDLRTDGNIVVYGKDGDGDLDPAVYDTIMLQPGNIGLDETRPNPIPFSALPMRSRVAATSRSRAAGSRSPATTAPGRSRCGGALHSASRSSSPTGPRRATSTGSAATAPWPSRTTTSDTGACPRPCRRRFARLTAC